MLHVCCVPQLPSHTCSPLHYHPRSMAFWLAVRARGVRNPRLTRGLEGAVRQPAGGPQSSLHLARPHRFLSLGSLAEGGGGWCHPSFPEYRHTRVCVCARVYATRVPCLSWEAKQPGRVLLYARCTAGQPAEAEARPPPRLPPTACSVTSERRAGGWWPSGAYPPRPCLSARPTCHHTSTSGWAHGHMHRAPRPRSSPGGGPGGSGLGVGPGPPAGRRHGALPGVASLAFRLPAGGAGACWPVGVHLSAGLPHAALAGPGRAGRGLGRPPGFPSRKGLSPRSARASRLVAPRGWALMEPRGGVSPRRRSRERGLLTQTG